MTLHSDVLPAEVNGWHVITWNREKHVLPLADLRAHELVACWCRPTPDDEDAAVIVHHALDERETFERGERKPS